MTPWDHVREAERLVGEAEAISDTAQSMALSQLGLLHVGLARAKGELAEYDPTAAFGRASARVKSIGRVHPWRQT
ncbi:hypothetical protein [Actinomadura litoris]|uniref:Uncharacterized protein n=1 Tax=Actinomadura litoris TaxID=2678616 RepID=A0A7K1LAP4_9ACTN|nr:hypothetical protein [Actinomadura litoris]MUN41488.1 hypothetical protein [Actinomadura litoris]